MAGNTLSHTPYMVRSISRLDSEASETSNSLNKVIRVKSFQGAALQGTPVEYYRIKCLSTITRKINCSSTPDWIYKKSIPLPLNSGILRLSAVPYLFPPPYRLKYSTILVGRRSRVNHLLSHFDPDLLDPDLTEAKLSASKLSTSSLLLPNSLCNLFVTVRRSSQAPQVLSSVSPTSLSCQ